MAKVYSVTPIELREGVKCEDFEKFWLRAYGPHGMFVGWKAHLLKADRGERAGKYAVIWEVPSVESRDRIVPEPGRISEEGLRLLGPALGWLNAKLDTFVSSRPYTDYVELCG